MSRIKCKGCQYEPSEYDTLSGYCLTCADKRVKEHDKLKASHTKLVEVIQAALRISDLWTLKEVETMFEDEAKALEMMKTGFEQALEEAEKI